MLKSLLTAAAVAFALPAFAHDGVSINDAYARVASPAAKSGAIFMVIDNHSAEKDRLVSASTDAAAAAELHTHIESADGVMQMVKVEEGFAIPGESSHALARGGDHVMLMGLTRPLNDGDTIHLKLTFARGSVVELDVPVDSKRADPPMAMKHDMGTMTHGN